MTNWSYLARGLLAGGLFACGPLWCGLAWSDESGDDVVKATIAANGVDVLRTALMMYEERVGSFRGASLAPLVSARLVSAVEPDPWGRPYLVDGNLGIVFTYGADGCPGGTGADADRYLAFKPPLQVKRAVAQGGESHRIPAGGTLSIEFAKPFHPSALEAAGLSSVIVVGNRSLLPGAPSVKSLEALCPGCWKVDRKASIAGEGRLVLSAQKELTALADLFGPTVDLVQGQQLIRVAPTAQGPIRYEKEDCLGDCVLIGCPTGYTETYGAPALGLAGRPLDWAERK